MTNPQHLLKLAQTQYPDRRIEVYAGLVHVYEPRSTHNFVYNPAENTKQSRELEIWLLGNDWIIDMVGGLYYLSHHLHGAVSDKDFAQGIIQAAFKVIGE